VINKAAVELYLKKEVNSHLWIKKLSKKELIEILPKCEFKTKPYKHQLAGILAGLLNDGFLFFFDLGTGKSLISLYTLKLRREDWKRVLVLSPNASTVSTFSDEIKKHTDFTCVELMGTKEERWNMIDYHVKNNTEIFIINYTGLLVLLTDPVDGKWVQNNKNIKKFTDLFDTIIADEVHLCFHKGTKISTLLGEKDISDINIGDCIPNLFGMDLVKNIYINKIPLEKVVKLRLNDNTTIFTTTEHLFYTNKGLLSVDKGLTKEGEEDAKKEDNTLLFKLQFGNKTKGNKTKILFSRLSCKTERKRKKHKNVKNMRILREDLHCRHKKEKILFNLLFCKMENGSARNYRENKFKSYLREEIRMDEEGTQNEPSHCRGSFFKNENKKPLKKSRSCRKDKENKREKWKSPCMERGTWGKWKINNTADNTEKCSPKRLETRTSNKNLFTRKRIPIMLQSRFRKQEIKDWGRDRWEDAQLEKDEIKRREERKEIERVGVESVEVYKQGCNDESFLGIISDTDRNRGYVEFYDLEIEGHPSYYANGVLVHNCKNPSSLTFKVCRKLFSSAKIRFGLTGTPINRDPMALWSQFYLVDKGETLGETLSLYREAFFDAKDNFWGGVDYKFKHKLEPLLNKKLSNKSLRYAEWEANELPEKVVVDYAISMPQSTAEYYSQVVDGIIEAQGNLTMIKNSFHKLRQLCSGYVNVDDLHIPMKENPKLDSLVDLINSVDDKYKIVVFLDYVKSGDIVCERLKKEKIKFERLYGGTKDKVGAKNKFLDDNKCKVLVANIKSGGVGLNLQKANFAIYYELPVSSIDYSQSEKRCILGGQKVLTLSGFKNIEEIKEGEKIITHNGNISKVKKLISKSERKKLFVDLEYFGFYEKLSVTEDHRVYVFDIFLNTYKWVKAIDLDIKNHYLVLPKLQDFKHKINKLNLKNKITSFTNNFGISQGFSKRKHNLREEVLLDEIIMFSLGWYLAEGWSTSITYKKYDKPSAYHCVGVCGNLNKEKNIVIDVAKTIGKYFLDGEFKLIVKEKPEKTCIECRISSKELAILFKEWFGEKSKSKRIPEWVFLLEDKLVIPFLEGYFKGDGYLRKNTQQISTASPIIASQLPFLLGKMGETCSVRYAPQARTWVIEYTLKNKQKNTKIVNKEGNILFPIKTKKIYKNSSKNRTVYDLEIAHQDHSFVVGLASVHNCHRTGQVNRTFIYRMITKESIEEKLQKYLTEGKDLFNALVEGKEKWK